MQKKNLQKCVCSHKYLFKFIMCNQQSMTSSVLILTLYCSVNTWSNSTVWCKHSTPNLNTYVWFVYMHSDFVTKMVLNEILRHKYLPFIVNLKCHWSVFIASNDLVFVTSSILIWFTWVVFANWNSYFNVFHSFAALLLWNRLWGFSWILTCVQKTKRDKSPSCR